MPLERSSLLNTAARFERFLRKDAGRSAFNATKGQAFSFKPHNYVAPAGALSSPATCRAAITTLHSEGFAAGGPQLPRSGEALERPSSSLQAQGSDPEPDRG